MKHFVTDVSGCALKDFCHSLGCGGVVIAVASGGTLIKREEFLK